MDGTLSYSIHGPTVSIRNLMPMLSAGIERMLGDLRVPTLPEGFSPIVGEILPYDADAVVRHLAPAAKVIATMGQLAEVYQHNERMWLVDDTWGLCEINLLRRCWRSWILPAPGIDDNECVDAAIVWPMAQLLRTAGVQLIPAASLAWNEVGTLLLSPFSLEPEVRALRAEEFELISQRWTAMMIDDGQVSLLTMPGVTQTVPPPRPRLGSDWHAPRWRDLADSFPGQTRHHAYARAVVLIEPGRRAAAGAHAVPEATAATILRNRWPMVELPAMRTGIAQPLLAKQAVVWQVQLSRDAGESARLIRSLIDPRSARRTIGRSLKVSLHVPNRTPDALAG